ncbi:hypothetical protein HPB52_021241 [Rhipicephalus sanguineus]|uniref:Uncharacterized protein n=1 Tax=Rhipicephalus sanguineus TaxID=34632 RepID=A0A9D4Q344_RHISA|nr:hypothetical protein HPB52_021241 [Rhipicephalus sanguineus]
MIFIVHMIARDLQPFEFVKNKVFQDLIRHLQPQYKISHRTTFSRTVIPELYRSTFDSLKTQITSNMAKGLESLAFTADMWTSMANEGNVSLTCHYMTQDFAVKMFTLARCPLQESHTAVNIQACLTEIVKEWSLDISNMPVRDNGWNIRAVVHQMEWIPLECLGHTLQLAIKDAKEEMPVVSSLCRMARAVMQLFQCLLTLGLQNPSRLHLAQSVLSCLERCPPAAPLASSLWMALASSLLHFLQSGHEVNQGSDLEPDFSALVAALTFPVHHALPHVGAKVRKTMSRKWLQLYQAFSCSAVLVPNVSPQGVCHEVWRRLYAGLTDHLKQTDFASVVLDAKPDDSEEDQSGSDFWQSIVNSNMGSRDID